MTYSASRYLSMKREPLYVGKLILVEYREVEQMNKHYEEQLQRVSSSD